MIIHLAARAHMKDKENDKTEKIFHHTNVDGTKNLASAAVKYGIKRFIYLSSVKAMSEESGIQPLNENMAPNPRDAYGRSKLKAEQVLLEISKLTKMEVVIL